MTASSDTGRSARMPWRLIAVLGAIAGLIALVFVLDLDRFLSLEALASHHAMLEEWVDANGVLAVAAYAAVYAVSVALSVPGATVLTLAGGLLFGIWLGGAVVVLSATAGAVGVFLLAKTALGEGLARRFGGWVERMRDGFRENAFSYMLFLRLVPVFPFVAVNLAPAVIGVPLGTYTLATVVGIAPASFIYASIGAGLGEAIAAGEDLSAASAISWQAVVGLVGLGLLALLPAAYRHWRGGKAAG